MNWRRSIRRSSAFSASSSAVAFSDSTVLPPQSARFAVVSTVPMVSRHHLAHSLSAIRPPRLHSCRVRVYPAWPDQPTEHRFVDHKPRRITRSIFGSIMFAQMPYTHRCISNASSDKSPMNTLNSSCVAYACNTLFGTRNSNRKFSSAVPVTNA